MIYREETTGSVKYGYRMLATRLVGTDKTGDMLLLMFHFLFTD